MIGTIFTILKKILETNILIRFASYILQNSDLEKITRRTKKDCINHLAPIEMKEKKKSIAEEETETRGDDIKIFYDGHNL